VGHGRGRDADVPVSGRKEVDVSDVDDLGDDGDELLLSELRAARGTDVPPDGLADRAMGLVAWIDVDHDLARLLEDADLEAAGMRGATPAETVTTFESADGTLIVEISIDGGRVSGRLIAGSPRSVVAERLDAGTSRTEVDELGEFEFVGMHEGPARLVFAMTGRDISTDWFVI
jgi:hypothetical protein